MKKLFLLSIIYLFINNLYGQESFGEVSGKVFDIETGEALQNVDILLKGTQKGAFTDKNGYFNLKNIPEGTYVLKVSFLGYEGQTKKINIKANQSLELNFSLQEESISLAEIAVVGKSEARKLREQAMPVSVISMQQLQGTVSDVKDVLARTVGVTIRSSGGVGSASRISVRGLEGKRIGFFIDGTPLNDNSDFIDINDIPVEMIDRIEIYKGVVPAKFGGSAIGGAVNIVIREYPPKYLDINYTTASFNTHKASAVAKRNTQNYELGVGGFYTYSDNNYKMQSPFDNDLIIKRDHDKFKKLAVGGSFKARNWWFDKVELEPIFMDIYQEIQGIEYNIQEAHTKSNVYILSNKLEKEDFLLAGLDFDWNLAYAFTEYRFIDKAPFRTNWDGTTYPAVSKYGGEIGRWASDSYDAKHTVLHKLNLNYLLNKQHSINLNSIFSFALRNPKDELKDKTIGYTTNFKNQMKSWTLGLNYDFRSKDDKFLNSFNVKYYWYDMNTTLSSISISVPQPIAMTRDNFGVSNALRYRFTPDFMAKMSLAKDIRLPSESELLGDGYMIAPSGDLGPEENTSFNFGLLYDRTGKSKSNLQLEVSAYYMYLTNMIRFTGGYLQSQYQNFGKMRTFGIEAEVKADVFPWLYAYANGTYQDLRDVRETEANSSVPNSTKGSRMPNIPWLMANTGAEFHKENLFGGQKQNTRIYADASFVNEYLYDFEQSKFQERRIPTTFSMNAGFEHSFANGRYFIIGRINNLTDTKMMSEFNRPLPGRNYSLRIRYVFK
ncbi:TonB-dependent receptor [Weeksellaceae bacterium TAE3-ERU29]|nr:TonB-dependent receptor [Weeksellaceae bacterium TAE3-ERU29]